MLINTKIQSVFDDYKTTNDAITIVTVSLDNSEMMSILSKKLYDEFVRMAPYAGYAPISDLSPEDILKYLKTLQYMRVLHVTSKHVDKYREYQSIARFVSVPVLFYQLLICIGNVYDPEFNLELRPAYNVSENDLLAPGAMEAISSLFRQFESSGMKVLHGIPKDESGDLDFMAMSHVDDKVVSYRKSHPVYGFFASFFKQKELNEITGGMSRVIYGTESNYRHQIEAVMQAIQRDE